MTVMDNRPECEKYPEQPCRCDCARLWGTRYLDDGEKLPGHVGICAMQASCASWIREMVPQGQTGAGSVVRELPDGRCTEPVQRGQWPVPIRGTDYQLVLVLRQWVEEEPDEQLARLFAEVDAWGRAVEAVRKGWAGDDSSMRELLLANGLPHTPGTMRYLRARVEDPISNSVPGPTRGVLVTSLVLESPRPGAHDVVLSQIAGALPWMTDTLRRKASRTVAEHGRWWSDLPHSSLPDLDLRRLNRRPPDEMAEDILLWRRGELTREEVEARAIQRRRELLGNRWEPGEKRRVLRRVGQRLREAERLRELERGDQPEESAL